MLYHLFNYSSGYQSRLLHFGISEVGNRPIILQEGSIGITAGIMNLKYTSILERADPAVNESSKFSAEMLMTYSLST